MFETRRKCGVFNVLQANPLGVYLTALTQHLEDACELALAVRNVSSVPPAERNDTLLQVAELLVDVHALLLDRLVRDSAPFQSLLGHVLNKVCGRRDFFCSHEKNNAGSTRIGIVQKGVSLNSA